MNKIVAYHVPGHPQKITKSVGMANAWSEAGFDVQPLYELPESLRAITGPPSAYCMTCGHKAPGHWDHCAESP